MHAEFRRILSFSVWCSLGCLVSFGDLVAQTNDSVLPASPPVTYKAARGLTHTSSAEAMGEGRLTFNLLGSWYGQENGFTRTPPAGTDVTTGLLSFSFGVNSYIDVFGSIGGYGLFLPAPIENDFGLGSVSGGIQGSLPLPNRSPLHLGAQMSIIGGTSGNQIDRNRANGYNYFETRTGYDFSGKIMETVVFGDESRGVKLHGNQGVVMSLQTDHDMLLLLSGGVQGSVHPMVVLGLELSSRTFIENIAMQADPLWLTPSLQFRSPYYFNVVFGSDISLSDAPAPGTPNPIEQFRIFGGFSFSFDLLARKRADLAEQEKRKVSVKDSLQRAAEAARAQADSIAKKAQADSASMARQRIAEQHRADSLALKAHRDSITLAETRVKLEVEKSKRSDAEKQLLSTGLLLLDAVYFETGKSEISINSFPYLNIIGKMLTKYPKLQIEVSGHTDNVGRFELNMRLSQTRAEAVRLYLIRVAPELAKNITSRGYGSTQPKAPNNTANGRMLNRRTELHVLNKDVLKEYNE